MGAKELARHKPQSVTKVAQILRLGASPIAEDLGLLIRTAQHQGMIGRFRYDAL